MDPSTAHYQMESYNRLLPCEPCARPSVDMVANKRSYLGYHFDASVIGEFANFAEDLLADYKQLLQKTNATRFAEILDGFVVAGWPEATRIVLQITRQFVDKTILSTHNTSEDNVSQNSARHA
jgi:hypothetical protein